MNQTKRFAQVHRYYDCVAAYLGDGSTVYMTPEKARRIAEALNACARDVAEFPDFGNSQFHTFETDLPVEQP